MAIGPIAQYYQNSKYYSARPPRPNKQVDSNLPHITIQMPVYREGLDAVLCVPSTLDSFFPDTICVQRPFGCIFEEGNADLRASGRDLKYFYQ
jgi:hypothetical protein